MNSVSRLALSAAAAIVVAAAAPVAAEPRSPWLGGSVVSVRGFSEDSGLPAGEYFDLGLFVEPFRLKFLNPSASVRSLIPQFPFRPGSSMIEFGVDIDLFSLRDHPLKGIMRQESALGPALAASWAFEPSRGIAAGTLCLTAHALRLRTGDARYNLLSPELLLDSGLNPSGWGLRLFEFSYFLF